MDGLLPLTWSFYPATAMLVLGLVLAVQGLTWCRAGFPRASASMQPLTWMRGFRMTIVGLALAGVGAAWLWDLTWLLLLSLAIGGEETLETSIAITALRAQQRSAAPTSKEGVPSAAR